jgi:ATP-dependent Clp protease protease subunit
MKFWSIKGTAGIGEVVIYGDIASTKWDSTDVTVKDFADALKALGDIKALNIYINSGGGDVFAGQGIFSILKRHKAAKYVRIDGLAASIASLVAMAGDKITMPANAMMMVHNPWTYMMGNAHEMRKIADDLDKIREAMLEAYLSKITISKDEFSALLDAETWLTARDCLEYGLCDEVIEPLELSASVKSDFFGRYSHTPEAVRQSVNMSDTEKKERNLIIEEARKIHQNYRRNQS